MLLPITSRRRALAVIPERPVYRAVVEAMDQSPGREGRVKRKTAGVPPTLRRAEPPQRPEQRWACQPRSRKRHDPGRCSRALLSGRWDGHNGVNAGDDLGAGKVRAPRDLTH